MKKILVFIFIFIFIVLSGCAENVINTEILTNDDVEISEDLFPVYGGNLNLSMRIPKTLNPLVNEDYTVDSILKLIFEPLFGLDENLKPTPNLAIGYSISNDGKVLTIDMKSGLTWHNGDAIKAEDVVFSLDVLKENPDSIYGGVLDKVSSYSSKGTQVFIEYIEPYSWAIYNLCFPIIPKNYYQNNLDTTSFNPVGSGSYKFLEYNLANNLILQKTTNFKGTPYIDTIDVLIISDRETDLYAFENNVIDSLKVNFSEWGQLTSNREKLYASILNNSYEFLGFNYDLSLYKNLYLRRAIAYCIPKDEIIQNIYLGTSTKTNTPINPNSWCSNYDEIENYEYNIQLATENLALANINLLDVKTSILVNAENEQRIEIAELIAKRLEQIGMSVSVITKPFDEYLAMLEAGDFDMFLGGIDFGLTPNFESFLTSSGTGLGGLNYCNFSDARMDLLVGNIYSAIGESNFLQAIREFEFYFSEQLPIVGLFFENEILLTDYTIVGEKNPNLYSEYNDIELWYIK